MDPKTLTLSQRFPSLLVSDLYDVVLGVAVVRPDPLLEEHAQREVLLEEGQHVLDRDAG